MVNIQTHEHSSSPFRKVPSLKHAAVRRGVLLLAAAAAVVAGMAFNWKWLAATSIAPLLVATLPCVALCAVGACMSRLRLRPNGADASVSDKISASKCGCEGGKP
ncbi:hypothetical protein [Pseudaminobacter soli (ex Li et al. 2025)]|uniref:hypothetical protein n=1 Tax=Pseudaminobacter soli (ex Li et al. 2025) TaxID=1295366 RepID=UPI0011B297A5|nr:hypothetical protein [Mesorhizobium soli]